MNSQPRRTRPGFTLVELLVVVTIVAILAALSVLAITKVRERAQAANAISSLRQIGMAQVAYAAENHGAINTLRDTNETREEGGPNAWVRNTFWGRMQPYLFVGADLNNQTNMQRQVRLGLNALFNTSNVDTMAGTLYSGNPKYGDLSGLSVPIGFNTNVRPPWNQPALRVATFEDPSRTIYIAYGRYFFNATHGREYRPMPKDGGPTASGIYYLANRKAFVAFLDGHVEALEPPIPERLFEP